MLEQDAARGQHADCQSPKTAESSCATKIEQLAKGLSTATLLTADRACADLAHCMPEYMHKILVDTPELSGAVCVYLTTKETDYLRGRYVSSCWDLPQLLERKGEILEKDLFKLRLAV